MHTRVLILFLVAGACAASPGRHFTVVDDIGLAQFDDPSYTGKAGGVLMSPNGKWAAVRTERGSLEFNHVGAELRFYDLAALRSFVNAAGGPEEPPPAWAVTSLASREGHSIQQFSWLADSSGLALLVKTDAGGNRLWHADLASRTVVPLTPEDQNVLAYDVRDRGHYAFTVQSAPSEAYERERTAPSYSATGRSIFNVLDPATGWRRSDRGLLWAAVGGPPKPVLEAKTGGAIVIYWHGNRNLKLSPDGRSLLTALCFERIPDGWDLRFPPAYAGLLVRVKPGLQDLSVSLGARYSDQYVTIDLGSGEIAPLTGTPTAFSAGWSQGLAAAAWSDDGAAVVLPGAYLPGDDAGARPGLVVADARRHAVELVRRFLPESAAGFEPGVRFFQKVWFAPGSSDRVFADYTEMPGQKKGTCSYHREASGAWVAESGDIPRPASEAGIRLDVKQSLDAPQVLVATDPVSGKSRPIWDPNPQLREVDLGSATTYQWTDRTGRKWLGGLYLPPGFSKGDHCPLVIQTHGFQPDDFRTSGVYPTAFAARALAGAGIAVLQVRDADGRQTPEEGPNNVLGYEAAVAELGATGTIDPDRVGIIGFSRTVYYVLTALTTSRIHFKSASITDGIQAGYVEYVLTSDSAVPVPEKFSEDVMGALIGSQPFGAGRDLWLTRSPSFNMDKVEAPLLVTGMKGLSTLFMWEPYANLRYLHKPVDLMVLNSDEHVLTNPGVRLASQGSNVDWFRFWLKHEEDPDPKKAEQYARWRKLRELHELDLAATKTRIPK